MHQGIKVIPILIASSLNLESGLSKNNTEKAFSTQSNREGFFLTSVEDNSNKENQPEAGGGNQKESRKWKMNKIKNSYGHLGSSSRFPSVNK